MSVLSALLAAALVVSAGRARAQEATITGRVHVAGDTLRALPDVEVALLPGLRTARTDSTGAFRFANVARGKYALRARRVGFDVTTLEISVGDGERRGVRIAMLAGAQALSEVRIAGRRLLYPARLADAYERVAHANGTFFPRELIDSLQPYDVKSLLSRVAGVHVNDRAVEFQRCVTGAALGSEAHVQVYVDGTRMTSYAIPGSERDANTALRDIMMSSVQLIEVYTGVARLPGEFSSDACAVLLIWTK